MGEGVNRPCDGGDDTLGLCVGNREEVAWGDIGTEPLVALGCAVMLGEATISGVSVGVTVTEPHMDAVGDWEREGVRVVDLLKDSVAVGDTVPETHVDVVWV